MASLLVLSAAPVQAQERTAELYRVKEEGGGLGVFIDQTVIFSFALKPVRSYRLIVERVRSYRHFCAARTPAGACQPGETRTHDWIDGESCAQVDAALVELSKIPMPSFANPDTLEIMTASDIPLLTIEGSPETPGMAAMRSSDKQLPLTTHVSVSQYIGPFREWWEKTQQALTPCWKPDAPRIDGSPVQAAPGLSAG